MSRSDRNVTGSDSDFSGVVASRTLEMLRDQALRGHSRLREVIVETNSSDAQIASIVTPDELEFSSPELILLLSPGDDSRTPVEICLRGDASDLATVVSSRTEPRKHLSGNRGPTDLALHRLRAFKACSARTHALALVDGISSQLAEYTERDLPPFAVAQRDDGSLLIEWLFPERRLGFSFEIDAKDSSWYYVSTESAGNTHASGNLATADIAALLKWVISDQQS